MHDDPRVQAYTAAMRARRVSAATAVPPLWHLMWSWGLRVPPPPFMNSIALFLLSGGTFGVLFAGAVWLIKLNRIGVLSLAQAGNLALLSGAFFGLVMTLYYRHLRRKHRLGSWDGYLAGVE